MQFKKKMLPSDDNSNSICPQRDIDYIIHSHRDHSKERRNTWRRWDEQTPYYIHPLWCATMLATETSIIDQIRHEGVQALLYHDVLEDTTQPLPDWLSPRTIELIHNMTFTGGISQKIRQTWLQQPEVRLYLLFDGVSNLLDSTWMNEFDKAEYDSYIQKLCEDVETNYGILNITKLARALET